MDAPSGFRGVFRDDVVARALYAEGAGIARCWPRAVAVPADADDVARLVQWARTTGDVLMPRGSGSGMAAGAVGTGVVVDLSRFDDVGTVDVATRRLVAGAGATCGAIDAAARAHGFRFPVDPSSGAFCTIGGMVGTNAAGARTLRFGATRAWIHGLQCVFDDGSIAWIRRDAPLPHHIPAVARLVRALGEVDAQVASHALRRAGVRKESSGYAVADALSPGGHLIDLLVGSEGTLALFTAVEVRLTPVATASATVLSSFSSLDAATACAVDACHAGAVACELLDRTFLDVARTAEPIDIDARAEAVLLIEVEAEEGAPDAAAGVEALARLCARHGAAQVTTATTPDAARALWALRHAASPILARLAPRLRSMQFIEDGCVPPAHFPAYVRGVRDALARFETTGVIFGHAGDAHAHVNPLVDTRAAGWRDRVHGLLDTVCDLTARLGGTLAGEHGDGRLRAPLWDRSWSLEARAVFAHVKDAADPSGVLNAGCKVALEGDVPFTTLRHDPDAPPLPTAVRAALDEVERTRTWHRYRLSLV